MKCRYCDFQEKSEKKLRIHINKEHPKEREEAKAILQESEEANNRKLESMYLLKNGKSTPYTLWDISRKIV